MASPLIFPSPFVVNLSILLDHDLLITVEPEDSEVLRPKIVAKIACEQYLEIEGTAAYHVCTRSCKLCYRCYLLKLFCSIPQNAN